MPQHARPPRTLSKRLLPLIIALVLTTPALWLSFSGQPIAPLAALLVFGGGIISAAFVLLWAGEAAQRDISGGLALAVLAVVAVLPEYAVDLYFAFISGSQPEYASYAAANMTGSNRLLLGFGWPAIVLIAWFAWRALKRRGGVNDLAAGIQEKPFALNLGASSRLDLGVLVIASGILLIVPLTGQIHLAVSLLLFLLFSWYLYRVGKGEVTQPELKGTAALIGEQSRLWRRVIVVALFVFSATVILVSAEPFAENLVTTGRELGIDDFLLVQWLAPLASESPEFIMAFILAFSGKGKAALALLLASKVNQWTLLVGSLPVAHVLGGGELGLPLDGRQTEEFILTAAQTMLGIAILLNLRLSARSALAIFLLFSLTFIFPNEEARWWIAGGYLVLAAIIFAVNHRQILPVIRAPFQKHEEDAPRREPS